jgi:peptidoglycan-N-acetylglucosamine deacetylase
MATGVFSGTTGRLREIRCSDTLVGTMMTAVNPWIYTGIGAAAGLSLVCGGCVYAAMYSESQIFGRALVAPPRHGELALTFDDGPNPAWTPRLLDILAGHDVHATFFVVGRFAQAEPGLVRRIAAAGHLIGNHSWSHPNLALTSATKVRDELLRTKDTLQQITGQSVRYFRPPFGARRPAVFRIARLLGMAPVLWNAMTSDWSEPSADAIAQCLMRRIDRLGERGQAANIVLHDGSHLGPGANREPSVNAAWQIISNYKRSHRFVTLEAWSESAYATR